jgi:hypothetical protein
LKLECDILLEISAFKFNLRRYTTGDLPMLPERARALANLSRLQELCGSRLKPAAAAAQEGGGGSRRGDAPMLRPALASPMRASPMR